LFVRYPFTLPQICSLEVVCKLVVHIGVGITTTSSRQTLQLFFNLEKATTFVNSICYFLTISSIVSLANDFWILVRPYIIFYRRTRNEWIS
jgi:hypothetical protein